MNPGVHDITRDDYYTDQLGDEEPSLNATVLKALVNNSPLHAWTIHPRLNPDYQPKRSTRFDLGTATHDVFLEGTDRVVVVNAADWRTKAAKQQRDQAYADGKIPLLADDADRVSTLLVALREQLPGITADPPLFAAAG